MQVSCYQHFTYGPLVLLYADQRFSLTDTVSFELTRGERLTHAFAFDRDFATTGYALLE